MKPLLFTLVTAALTVGIFTAVNAHEGHDHGPEPGNQTAPPEANSPPAPPSDTFVPESRPLENSPPSRERRPNFTPKPENRPSRDFRDFEPEPRDFVPPSRPSRSLPPINDRPLFTNPDAGRLPNYAVPELESRPRDFIPPSSGPLGHSFQGECPSGRHDSFCPNDNEFAAPRLCPFGRGHVEKCPWGNDARHGLRFDGYEPSVPPAFLGDVSSQCPTGDCGHTHPGTENRGSNEYDRLAPAPIRQPAPYFRDEPTDPSAFQTFEAQPPRTFGN